VDGLLNVYKERGFTSHDVVAKLRGILKQKKIGHTGTLDPEAEGVLPVCLGKATKVCGLLTDKDKEYRTVLLLGRETDTQDVWGQTLRECAVKTDEETVEKAIMDFVGEYDQLPPMYSALKVGGKKLYELARQGKEVERQPRRVRIHGIEIEKLELPRVTMTVSCSKGTYIRTLCHDIGKKLGFGGCMESLVRTRVAQFCLEDAKSLGQIEAMRDAGTLGRALTAVDTLFLSYPAFTTAKEAGKRLYNGNPLEPEDFCETAPLELERIRIYDSEGWFIGIYSYDRKRKVYRPETLFFTEKKTAAGEET
jgi:tRNA pseudouridine55 synthase